MQRIRIEILGNICRVLRSAEVVGLWRSFREYCIVLVGVSRQPGEGVLVVSQPSFSSYYLKVLLTSSQVSPGPHSLSLDAVAGHTKTEVTFTDQT